LAKNSDSIYAPSGAKENKIPWVRTLVGLLVSAVSIYYFANQIDFAQLGDAFRSAKITPIFWAVVVLIITGFAKAWRWQWLYYPAVPKFRPTFHSIMSGQLINLLSPIPRLGDVARLYQMKQSSQIAVGQTLGTLVSEKSFDFLLTVLLAIVIIPIYNVPDFVSQQMFSLALIALFIIIALYFFVYQAERILKITAYCLRPFPEKISSFTYKLADRSLAGLAVLKHGRITLYLILLSTAIGILSFVTPLLLFVAFDLPLGLPEALLLNAVLLLSLSLPSAPGRIGTFEPIVVGILLLFGLSESPANWAFALMYHAVGLVTTLVIGGWSLAMSDWKISEIFNKSAQ
jgi:uncharacterized protein (TIRG00374 family)